MNNKCMSYLLGCWEFNKIIILMENPARARGGAWKTQVTHTVSVGRYVGEMNENGGGFTVVF